jgi:hypothetical protein
MKKYIDRDALAEYAHCQYGMVTASDIMEFPTADVQPVKHGRWIEIEPMLKLIEHIQMILTTIYDTGGCIQSGDMKCLIETSDRLKELVKESGCYMKDGDSND